MPFEPTNKIGSLSDGELVQFLTEPWNARVAVMGEDGWPYVTPVWYDYEADRKTFVVVGRERAEWVRFVQQSPRVALHIADDVHVQHTRVLVQGMAEVVEGPIAPSASPRLWEITERMSLRYLGPKGPEYAKRTADRPRLMIRITPHRWRTWTGQEWHPRYR